MYIFILQFQIKASFYLFEFSSFNAWSPFLHNFVYIGLSRSNSLIRADGFWEQYKSKQVTLPFLIVFIKPLGSSDCPIQDDKYTKHSSLSFKFSTVLIPVFQKQWVRLWCNKQYLLVFLLVNMNLIHDINHQWGLFLLFDRRPNHPWKEKIWHRTEIYKGRMIEVWRM